MNSDLRKIRLVPDLPERYCFGECTSIRFQLALGQSMLFEGPIQHGWIGIERDTSASGLWPLYLLGHNTNTIQENSETLQQIFLLGYNRASVIS